MRILRINNFKGIKVDVDPRVLEPNRDDTGKADAVGMNNMETNKEGALITSPGYELVADAGAGAIKFLLNYEKTPEDKFLIVVRDDQMYYLEPGSKTLEYIGSCGNDSEVVNGCVYKGRDVIRKAIITSSDKDNYPKAIILGEGSNLSDGQIKVDNYKYENIDSSGKRISQSFKYESPYTIKKLELRVKDVGSPANLSCDIYECDDYGKPTGASLSTSPSSISGASSKYGTMRFDINWACPDYEKEYAFVISGATASGTDYYLMLKTETGGEYKNGTAFTSNDSGATWSAYGDSIYFLLYRDTSAQVGSIKEEVLKGGTICTPFLGHLFVAKDATWYYSGIEDETSWGSASTGDAGAIGVDDTITGCLVEGDRLISFIRSDNQGIKFNMDDNDKLIIPYKDYLRKYGCIAPKSVQAVGSNAVYLSEMGVVSLGVEERFDSMGLPRPLSVSEDIDPYLDVINRKYTDKVVAKYLEKDRKYWLCVPTGKSVSNDGVFVYDVKRKVWHTRSGFNPGAIETFRNEDGVQETFFGNANSGEIYKFNDSYNYDGDGYKRMWKSKIFTFGHGTRMKQINHIRFAGAMSYNTEFYITLKMDGTKRKYKVDSSFILGESFSDYIGDNIRGDAWKGGESPEDSQFKRFYAPLDISKDVREGLEFQITIENEGADQPFKIDEIEIAYTVLDAKQVPRKAYINKQVTT